jgi:hypothetical protein
MTMAKNTRDRFRRWGWVAVALFTLKGVAWLALGAGAWSLFR